jgi:hypothetical protein
MQPVVTGRRCGTQGGKLRIRRRPLAFCLCARQGRSARRPGNAPSPGSSQRCRCAAVPVAFLSQHALAGCRHGEDRVSIGIARIFVVALDQQPSRFAATLLCGAHQLPGAMQFFAM